MYAEKLPEFSEFAPQYDAGGDVSTLQAAADMRRSCHSEIGDAEGELGGAKFGKSKGEVYDSFSDHSKKLKRALASAGEVQIPLAAKIECYAERLDGLQRQLDNMKSEASNTHSTHQKCVEAYNRAVDAAIAASTAASAQVAEQHLDQKKLELESAIRDWDNAMGDLSRERENFSNAVDEIARNIKAGARPAEPLSFKPASSVTEVKHDDPGVSDSLVRIAKAADIVENQLGKLADLGGCDNIRGAEIQAAVRELDDEWRPYLQLARGALIEFKEKAAEFSDKVRSVDEANGFSFDSMKLDTYQQRVRFADKYASNLIGATLAAGEFPFTAADLHNENIEEYERKKKQSDQLMNVLDRESDGPKIMIEPDKGIRAVSRAGGLAFSGAGFAVDYNSARDEGYSKGTAFGSAAVGAGVSTLVASGGGLLIGAAVFTGPGLLALLGVTALSAGAGMIASSTYKTIAEY